MESKKSRRMLLPGCDYSAENWGDAQAPTKAAVQASMQDSSANLAADALTICAEVRACWKAFWSESVAKGNPHLSYRRKTCWRSGGSARWRGLPSVQPEKTDVQLTLGDLDV